MPRPMIDVTSAFETARGPPSTMTCWIPSDCSVVWAWPDSELGSVKTSGNWLLYASTLADDASGKFAPEATIAVRIAPTALGDDDSFPVVPLYWLLYAPDRLKECTLLEGGKSPIAWAVSYWVVPNSVWTTEMLDPVLVPLAGPPQV